MSDEANESQVHFMMQEQRLLQGILHEVTLDDHATPKSPWRTFRILDNVDPRAHSIDQGQKSLLPSISDEITLVHIVPKLPWRTFHILSSVSRDWRQEIKSRRVYDARVFSEATQTLVVVNHFRSEGHVRAIGLYSMKDTAFYQLPVIPKQETGIPRSSQCISLNGKVYVLGGKADDRTVQRSSSRVFVMDIAGQSQWKECASMEYGRHDFGAAVLNGKIYVCGGKSGQRPVLVPEVYDPDLDIWSPIKPMLSMRFDHKVTTLADELFVQGGEIYNSDYEALQDVEFVDGEFVEVYNPVRDEWRKVETVGKDGEALFMADGKVHATDKEGIRVYHNDTNSCADWLSVLSTERCLYGCRGVYCLNTNMLWTTIAVEDELVAILRHYYGFARTAQQGLFYTGGFGGRKETIWWERAECPFQMGKKPFICSLQL